MTDRLDDLEPGPTTSRSAAFVDGITVPDLGFAAGMALWGFRACARGQVMCCAVIHGFERVFGDDAPMALAALYALSRTLGTRGRRTVSLAAPGCAGVTADELSLAALFAAGQAGDAEKRDAHLAWLFAGGAPAAAARAADRLGLVFAKHGLAIRAPDLAVSAPAPTPRRGTLTVHAGGRA